MRDRGAETVLTGVDEIADEWRELCRWDPALPPESAPPIAPAVITAIGQALQRPQPIGWGSDPEVEKVIDVFSRAVGSTDVAIGQLACLREAVRRHLTGVLGAKEEAEITARLHVLLDRAIGRAANRTVERLRDAEMVDPVTGLPNRRALERDVRREVGRADRYRRHFALIVVDIAGMGEVNHRDGFVAGDDVLRRMATALTDGLRIEDSAFRLDADDFAVLLPEIEAGSAGRGAGVVAVAHRISSNGAPSFAWGAASFPSDGSALDELMVVATDRLGRDR